MNLRTALVSTLVVTLVALGFVLGERHMRLGRDLIFRSDDVAEFVLSNGKVVQTNRWYNQIDLLTGRQEFYLSPEGLGITKPHVPGFATTMDEEGRSFHLNVPKVNTTILDMSLAMTPVGQEAVRAGVFDEYWISRQDAAIEEGSETQ